MRLSRALGGGYSSRIVLLIATFRPNRLCLEKYTALNDLSIVNQKPDELAQKESVNLEYLSWLDVKSIRLQKGDLCRRKVSASKKQKDRSRAGHRWVPTGKLLNSCTGKIRQFNGKKQQRIDITADALYNEKQENLRVWLLKFLISKKPVPEWPRSSMLVMTSVHISSGLVLHQMTSDHNRSELGIQDHSNEPSSSKLVPKVVP
ncbi:hypothetical protein Tco_1337517 [Tanacetum coccineum]